MIYEPLNFLISNLFIIDLFVEMGKLVYVNGLY